MLQYYTIYLLIYLIDHYNPSVRIIDLASHTTYIVYVNIKHKCRDRQFKVYSERQTFWETFHDNFCLLSEFLPEICWEKIAEEILFVFCFDVWLGARTLSLRLISQPTDYSFNHDRTKEYIEHSYWPLPARFRPVVCCCWPDYTYEEPPTWTYNIKRFKSIVHKHKFFCQMNSFRNARHEQVPFPDGLGLINILKRN